MASIFLRMAQGEAPSEKRAEPLWSILPPVCLGAAVLVLGIYIPPFLTAAIQAISPTLGGP
jgi:hypothetical protein